MCAHRKWVRRPTASAERLKLMMLAPYRCSSVEEGFRTFHTRLSTSRSETDAAKGHRASIDRCLRSRLGMQRFFRIGSFGNGTNISAHSDVDYLACFPERRVFHHSRRLLGQVRRTLDTRFPNTGVGISCPAVKVPFGTLAAESTEVVPAILMGSHGPFPLYRIAAPDNAWMPASPEAHNAYVAELDRNMGGKLKPLIRFVKAWKYYWEVPISSFYLEIAMAIHVSGKTRIVYGEDVHEFFRQLYQLGLPNLQDPMRVSESISPCTSPFAHRRSSRRLRQAEIVARQACKLDGKGETRAAINWWRRLYKQRFPRYRAP